MNDPRDRRLHQSVNLEFDVDSESARANSLHKLDSLTAALWAFARGVEEEFEQYERRGRETHGGKSRVSRGAEKAGARCVVPAFISGPRRWSTRRGHLQRPGAGVGLLAAAQVRHGKMIAMQVVGYPNHPEPAARMVGAALERGGVAVIPTDTVYGLACLPSWPDAVQRVFALKGRPPERRLPVIVGSQAEVDSLGIEFGDAAARAAAAFWPGALTIVVGVGEPKVDWLAGRDEVAIRMPESDLVSSLTALVGPFLMTSANAHGGTTLSTLRAVLTDLAGEPDVVVDGGPLSLVSSTLLNVNLPEPAIEREGAIPSAAVMDALRG